MVAISIVLTYLIIGFNLASWRAWRKGIHRAACTSGGFSCKHWACDTMSTEITVLLFFLWPIIGILISASWWFKMLAEKSARKYRVTKSTESHVA